MDKLAEIVLTAAAKRSLEVAFDGVKSLLKRYTSDPIWKLKRKGRGHQRLRSSAESVLPEELWVRGSLLAGVTTVLEMPRPSIKPKDSQSEKKNSS
jgi:hypothetical protein